MSFNFDAILQQGKVAAENVKKNRAQIKEVLSDLEESLKRFLDVDLKHEQRIEYLQNQDPMLALTNMLKPTEITGYKLLYIKNKKSDEDLFLFKIKFSEDIYPVTIVREKNHIVADDQNEFADAVGQIMSSSQLHLKLGSFRRRVDEKIAQLPKPVPKDDEEPG
tara:strand:+ start:2180 stop:2671 length:492 start_codon:yes stop_codon:yes gene_type:complete